MISLDSITSSPMFATLSREMRRDVEKDRSQLARDFAAATKKAGNEEEALQTAFDAALTKRNAVNQAFAVECNNVQLAQAALTSARLMNRGTLNSLQKQLIDSADPAIAAAIVKTDDMIESERRHNAGFDRQAASDARIAALRASRAELEALLIGADVDTGKQVAAILGRPEFR